MASFHNSVPNAVIYLVLLRFPLVCFAILATLKWVALSFKRNLLANLFDVDGPGMAVVTTIALLCSWTVLTTTWLIFAYGSTRLGLGPPLWPTPPTLLHYSIGAFLGLFVVSGIFEYSPSQNPSRKKSNLWWGFAAGVMISFLLLATILHLGQLLEPVRLQTHRISFLFRFIGPQGYLDDQGNLLGGHFGALTLFGASLLVYVILGFQGRARHRKPSEVPTLTYVLLLLMLACWFLPAVAFALDPFHVPILLTAIIYLSLFSASPRTDHFFNTSGIAFTRAPDPAEVLRYPEAGKVILVAASGGGIQAGAWTARVLTGLEQKFRSVGTTEDFARSIRLISSVSGGSVGCMYFTSSYGDEGTLPVDLQRMVDDAASSCLEDIAWGLAYADLLRVLLPRIFWRLGGRGRALERAWMRTETMARRPATRLSDWFESVRRGNRPANIFNATITETGDRLLFSTTYLPVGKPPTPPARWDFHHLFADKDHVETRDVAIVTAARLSATFPYVTPAARPDIGGPDKPQIHVVDGGYFDNYGLCTLLEWLDNGLTHLQKENSARFEKLRILVLEIHEAPDPHRIVPPTVRQPTSWLFQLYAPLATLFGVRTSGQRSHNQLELGLMQEKWKNKIEHAIFEFGTPEPEDAVDPGTLRSTLAGNEVAPKNDASAKGKPLRVSGKTEMLAAPPLSWHLTEVQKEAIEQEWELQLNNSQWKKVYEFLNGHSN